MRWRLFRSNNVRMNTATRLGAAPRQTPTTEKHATAQRASCAQGMELEPPKTSILILTRNEAENIGPCLDTVLAQKFPSPLEIILIDSESSDRTVEIASRYPLKLYRVAKGAFHHARTRNLAAELAQGEYLVYLAADALPRNDNWLSALLGNFENSRVGAVYGRHLPRRGASIERRTVLERMYGDMRLEKCAATRAELGYRYYHFSTVNCAIRRTAWQQTGFPRDLNVFEDVALAARILDAGWSIVYEPDAAVHHSHQFSAVQLFQRYFDMGVVYRHLNIWTRTSKAMLLRDGVRSVRAKLNLSQNHYSVSERGAGICQDAAKFAGLVLGRNQRWLPRALKRRLSAFGLFE